MKNLGVFGGTFDPPHLGHLILAQSAYENLNLDKVLFIPAGKQPHKQNVAITAKEHRLEMLKLAIDKDSRFEISQIELNNNDLSYTYKTLRRMKELHLGNKLYFLIGGDNISEIETWMKPDEIFELANVASAGRPEFKQTGRYKDQVIMFDMPQIEISSTMIRKMAKKGLSIKYLVPEKVEHYIIENGLYIS
jgi:nicotinate-nucleotide adenylyltransferase